MVIAGPNLTDRSHAGASTSCAPARCCASTRRGDARAARASTWRGWRATWAPAPCSSASCQAGPAAAGAALLARRGGRRCAASRSAASCARPRSCSSGRGASRCSTSPGRRWRPASGTLYEAAMARPMRWTPAHRRAACSGSLPPGAPADAYGAAGGARARRGCGGDRRRRRRAAGGGAGRRRRRGHAEPRPRPRACCTGAPTRRRRGRRAVVRERARGRAGARRARGATARW